jgi:hypothetical protein
MPVVLWEIDPPSAPPRFCRMSGRGGCGLDEEGMLPILRRPQAPTDSPPQDHGRTGPEDLADVHATVDECERAEDRQASHPRPGS